MTPSSRGNRSSTVAALRKASDGRLAGGVRSNAPHEVWRAAVAEHEAASARLFDP